MKNQQEQIKFILERVYECQCFEDPEEFSKLEKLPENGAVLVKGVWCFVSNSLPSIFNPFFSMSDAQSMLVHIFYNRPTLKNEPPIITRKQLADKILDQNIKTLSREQGIGLLFTVSSVMITEAVIAILEGH